MPATRSKSTRSKSKSASKSKPGNAGKSKTNTKKPRRLQCAATPDEQAVDSSDEPKVEDDHKKEEHHAMLPTLANYANVDIEWTDTYADKLLARRKTGSNN
ncbi:uncharacterized protein MELLADRAFT_69515 [Melampsora larici-populina 98AG31]|uniref:Uncharacterized protein n=1 Tax=Melampsora larici-populina (strain 98AG31 / pathotype 3-4-7) TaxID=747676 RepID=F4SB09_MELLP|nr:uncharacterized protein MELLADRAFT_69515 [Melampsora larici-populina 98AG31]EGF98169.1 hypothetical protein MELLADRAFT_69515 [Melampsora larici-populina 98AG31]